MKKWYEKGSSIKVSNLLKKNKLDNSYFGGKPFNDKFRLFPWEIDKIISEDGVGVKHDSDKLPYYTVLFKQFPNALREVVKCSAAGHQKYKDTDKDYLNYLRLDNADTRYKNAMLRHMTEEGIVEDMRPYGEITHAGAVVWNALADLEIKLRRDESR